MADATPLLAAPSGYKILKKMGQGGMATVYLAVQESFGRQVALKIMSDELGQDSVWARRFIHEAQVVAQLSHPNIVPVFDVGSFNGRFFISMELLKGGNLDDKIAKGLTISEIVKIIVGVAAGLDFAGEKGFVHRDIKPDNVMFREDGSPVILDFGIVKQKGGGSADKMTQTGTIVGTTAYMSPEQAMGKELDEGSDIYSLGIMFYELLAGHVPFHGDSAVDVLMKHVNEPPPPLPEFVRVFQPVIDKALAKNRAARYPRARAMIEHLQELEPQIRQLLSKPSVASAQHSVDEVTSLQAGFDITRAMNQAASSANVTRQIAEDELTDVLSSAKATISNFSEETRQRRTRNTRRSIAAAVVVVVLALGYIAYQQFYVVPRAAQQANIQRQEKIATRLLAANEARDKLIVTNLKAADGLIAQYREILVLDPENVDVHKAMDELGQHYVELANTERTNNNLALAESYRDYAEQLAPKNTQLLALRDSLKNARAASEQKEFAGEFKQGQITSLLNDAEKNIHAGQLFSPAEDSAYGKYQQILKLDSDNAEAQHNQSTLTNNLYSETQTAISGQQWRTVATNLDLLDRFYPDKSKVATLKSEYSTAKQKADEQAKLAGAAQKKESLLDQAAQLKREPRTRANNSELRNAYLDVLALESTNTTALAGLDDTSRAESEFAEQAIKQRDFARASQSVADIENATPSYNGLSTLKTKLSQAKSSVQKADQWLATANELTNSNKVDDAKRLDLANAYSAIESAKQIDPANPAIPATLAALENQYLIALGPLMASQQRTLVDAYFNDAANKDWPTDRIMKAQLTWKSAPTTTIAAPTADKPKPKRVMSGGF